jgi:hypothetical protein
MVESLSCTHSKEFSLHFLDTKNIARSFIDLTSYSIPFTARVDPTDIPTGDFPRPSFISDLIIHLTK